MKKIELYLPLLVLTLLMEACASVDDAPTAAVAAQSYPVTPPTVTPPPYRFCSGPNWTDECDLVFFLRNDEEITGPGVYARSGALRGEVRPAPRPNFLGWVLLRANANEWRRAYMVPITRVTDEIRQACAGDTSPDNQVYWMWPQADGRQLTLVAHYNNPLGSPHLALDGDLVRVILYSLSTEGWAERREEVFAKPSFTYTITSARRVYFDEPADNYRMLVSTITPIVDRDYLVWF